MHGHRTAIIMRDVIHPLSTEHDLGLHLYLELVTKTSLGHKPKLVSVKIFLTSILDQD